VLTERRAAILQLIIDDYIESATPVGSENIVRTHRLGLSPATIRIEMARLEEDGFISHPHTSAGRVPSDKGYRYYVESLMQDAEISPDEKLRILHQFHQASTEVAEWLQLAASVLAQSLQSLAVVTAPRTRTSRLKHLQLVELNETTVLLVLVTQDVKVHQQMIALPEPSSQEELTRLAARLNRFLEGREASAFTASAAELNPIEELIMRAAAAMMQEEDAAQYTEPHVEGIRNVLRQPEFSRSDKMLDVIEAVEERNLAKVIPFETISQNGVTVIIGAEHRQDAMRECSVVVVRYGAPESGASGAIGILGPTRMRYPRAIATVQYLGEVMSELMLKLYG
jgi:heat-inducible transcriptional repressor